MLGTSSSSIRGKSMELPEECWELIFKTLDHHRYHESLSLASTSFLSLTDRLRSTLTITDQTVPFLPKLLRRFRNLKRIRFREFRGNLYPVLMQISRSGLDLESVDVSGAGNFPDMEKLGLKMRHLRELNCSGVRDLEDNDLLAIGIYFPFLQELDISYPKLGYGCSSSPVTDSGVISLSSKLKSLRKINLSGNQFITDKSMVSLSQNCLFLREIVVRDCDFITPNGIRFVLRNSQNLESVSVNGIGLNPFDSGLEDAFSFARSLSEFDLSDSFLFDEFLCLIADANFQLKKLVLSNCYCFTFYGISCLLSKFQSLVHLDLEGSSFLTDESIMELGKSIQSLIYLNLSFCSKLTGLAFLAVIENCALLNRVKMEGTNFGVEEFSKELEIKSGLKSLCIARNNNLSDECLNRVARYCPFLELLDVAQCPGITGDGILEVMKNCCKLTYLDMSKCTGIKTLNIDFELPKLEALRACGIWIDDEDLEIISMRCRGLLYLDLEGCLNVTPKGAREVLQNCTSLRELNLKHCEVGADLLTRMICSRPSLRKIIPPCGFILTENRRNFFLRHGCVISLSSNVIKSQTE